MTSMDHKAIQCGSRILAKGITHQNFDAPNNNNFVLEYKVEKDYKI
jgi:hypothetical protein